MRLLQLGRQRDDNRFRLWVRLIPYARVTVLSLLPCPDLPSRLRMRRAARKLGPRSPWPEENATSIDAARLALLRLLWLQQQTRRAVRGRHHEASVVLARACLEACILGSYCLHEDGAAAHLDAAGIKSLRDALRFLEGRELVPAEVIEQCIAGLGAPRWPPKVGNMAELVDRVTGGSGAVSLYRMFYIPTSTFFVHAGAGSLMRHVGSRGKVSLRPTRAWTRRSPVRVADACTGILASGIAQRTGRSSTIFSRYAERHLKRALAPMTVMAVVRYAGSATPSQVIRSLKAASRLGTYVWSGQAAGDSVDVRTARIREEFVSALQVAELTNVPPAAIDPLLNYLAAWLAGTV